MLHIPMILANRYEAPPAKESRRGNMEQSLKHSDWRRWDPHIHTPGSALEDQFDDDWDGYFERIETADPPSISPEENLDNASVCDLLVD